MNVWLVVHVLAAIGGIGPEIAFGVMGPRARRRGRVTATAVYESIAEVRTFVVFPCLGLQVVSGIALILLGGHSILQDAWLGVSLILYALALVIVLAVLVPGSKRARSALANGVDPDDATLRPLWARQAAAGSIAGSFLITVAILMVLKPR